MIEEAGIELSEIYGGGKEDISGVNPLAKVAGKGPSGVKPQDDWASQTANTFRSKLQQFGVGNRAASAAPAMPSTSFRGVPPPAPTSFSSPLPPDTH